MVSIDLVSVEAAQVYSDHSESNRDPTAVHRDPHPPVHLRKHLGVHNRLPAVGEWGRGFEHAVPASQPIILLLQRHPGLCHQLPAAQVRQGVFQGTLPVLEVMNRQVVCRR